MGLNGVKHINSIYITKENQKNKAESKQNKASFLLFPLPTDKKIPNIGENMTNLILDNGKFVDFTDERQDGMISTFSQGKTGDCWLLSSLKVLSDTEKGKFAIKNSIKKYSDDSYIIQFKGAPGKTYIVTEKEIEKATKLSTGDKDVKILEIAIGKWNKRTHNKGICGGEFKDIKKLLLDEETTYIRPAKNKQVRIKYKDKVSLMNADAYFSKMKDGKPFYVNFHPKKYQKFIHSKSGEQFYTNHAYSAKKLGDSMWIHNPHDTGKTPQIIKITDFLNMNCGRIYY